MRVQDKIRQKIRGAKTDINQTSLTGVLSYQYDFNTIIPVVAWFIQMAKYHHLSKSFSDMSPYYLLICDKVMKGWITVHAIQKNLKKLVLKTKLSSREFNPESLSLVIFSECTNKCAEKVTKTQKRCLRLCIQSSVCSTHSIWWYVTSLDV